MAEYDEREEGYGRGEDAVGKAAGAVARVAGFAVAAVLSIASVIVLIPAIIVAVVVRMMLTKYHWRPKAIFVYVVLPMIMVGVISLFLIGGWTMFASGFTELWSNGVVTASIVVSIIVPLLLMGLVVGGVVGMILVHLEVRLLHKSAHMLSSSDDTWKSGFKFKLTPKQNKDMEKYVEKCRDGLASNESRVALGYEEDFKDPSTIRFKKANKGSSFFKKGETALEPHLGNPVYRYYSEAATHTLIVGASGSGKTVTIKQNILQDIKNGRNVIMVNFKPEPDDTEQFALWCKQNNMRFLHFVKGSPSRYQNRANPQGQSYYDPIHETRGEYGARADMVLNMRTYDASSDVYRASMQEVLQVLFRAMDEADRDKAPSITWDDGGIYQINSVLKGDNMSELVDACEGKPCYSGIEALNESRKASPRNNKQAGALGDLRGQVATLINSEYGRWMHTPRGYAASIGEDPERADDNMIDLFKLMGTDEEDPDGYRGTMVCFDIAADAEPEFGRFVGSLLFSDITNLSSYRRDHKASSRPVMVYADEFQAVTPQTVTKLLEKCRSAGMGVTLSLQSLAQIVQESSGDGQSVLDSIITTVSNYIIHAGSDQQAAERLASVAGQDKFAAYRIRRQNQNFILAPNFIKRLSQDVTTDTELDWVVSPSAFTNLSRPNPQAGETKTTAIVMNRANSDPRYKDYTDGVVGRLTRMIPSDEVFEKVSDNAVMSTFSSTELEKASHLDVDESSITTADPEELDGEEVESESPQPVYGIETYDDGNFTFGLENSAHEYNTGEYVESFDDEDEEESLADIIGLPDDDDDSAKNARRKARRSPTAVNTHKQKVYDEKRKRHSSTQSKKSDIPSQESGSTSTSSTLDVSDML